MESTPCPTKGTHNNTPLSRRVGNPRVESHPGDLTISFVTVLITTEEAATAPHVLSHMCVGGVDNQHIPPTTASKREHNLSSRPQQQQQQLQEAMYVPQTPLKCR